MHAALKKLAKAAFNVLRTRKFGGSRNQRAIAETIADTLTANWSSICSGLAQDPQSGYPPRHMADVSCVLHNADCWIDIKTRNVGKPFSMPNLTSVKRLDKFYSEPTNCFIILRVDYRLDSAGDVIIQAIDLIPVEALDWSCLQIVALGRGQLQIADAKHVVLNRKQSREVWLRSFYERLVTFYKHEMVKDQRDVKWATGRLKGFLKSQGW